ncbi:WAS/WASL-interacting protein family member 1-like [Pan troglodytes]|uniref:WAS/WASL-interacting protein family member 1-like n=1 Tax=Pan troglodytes TaxID=9598 RepID=UPI003013C8D0
MGGRGGGGGGGGCGDAADKRSPRPPEWGGPRGAGRRSELPTAASSATSVSLRVPSFPPRPRAHPFLWTPGATQRPCPAGGFRGVAPLYAARARCRAWRLPSAQDVLGASCIGAFRDCIHPGGS